MNYDIRLRKTSPMTLRKQSCALDRLAFMKGLISRKSHFTRVCGALVAFVLWATGLFAEDFIASPDFRNRVFSGPPNIPGVDNSHLQPESMAVVSGSVGAAGKSSTPNDGKVYLLRSVIGQSVGGQSARIPGEKTYKIGEPFAPAGSLGVNGSVRPASISPAALAAFIPGLDRVVATGPGFVDIQWIRQDGTTNSPVSYFVENNPIQDPVVIYHTHASGGDLNADLGGLAGVPRVTIPSGLQLQVFYNQALPDTNAVTFNLVTREMRAKSYEGFFVLTYRDANAKYLSLEVVDVRRNVTSGAATLVDVGSALAPYVVKPNPAKPVVSQGIDLQNAAQSSLYQHDVQGSPQFGAIYAIHTSTDETKMEVYWRKNDSQNVAWPYELHHYLASWPSSAANYQRYVRGAGSVKGPDVIFSSDLNATLMPFQEPAGHAQPVNVSRFSTTTAGWSLLKYRPTNAVYFQVVRSVLDNDASQFNLTKKNWDIGREITEDTHQGPRGGYIYAQEGDRYDWETYEGQTDNPPHWDAARTTGQIFAVNTGTLEVWWSNVNPVGGVQWPSLVKRYNAVWPADPERIVIASQKGTGPIPGKENDDFRLYYQNDPSLHGFNPNDEHALIFGANGESQGASKAIYALRDDLGTPATSEPYVLVKQWNLPGSSRWSMRAFRVFAEGVGSDGTNYVFNYPAVAGAQGLLVAPYPVSYLNFLERCDENAGVSGPLWRDRKKDYWARAAGDDGGTSTIVMRFFYSTNVFPGMYFPPSKPAVLGPHVAWLDRRTGGTPGVPTDIKYTVSWPANLPTLRVGETLATAKFGLPSIYDQTSVEILYQQSATNRIGDSVVLIDPTREYSVTLDQLPADLPNASEGGKYFFTTFPPQLRQRIWWDPVNHLLKFKGQLIQPVAGEYYLFLNVLTERERSALVALTKDGPFLAALNALAAKVAGVMVVPPNVPFDHLALTAGVGRGTGYVTLAFNNSTNLNQPPDPISLAVIQVSTNLYKGELKVIPSDNPFDEQLTLRHSGDFAGKADEYQFEWHTLPPENGGPSSLPRDQWATFVPTPNDGKGAVDITIKGPGTYTLSDNWFVCRYRALNPANPVGTNTWSEWTDPMLAEGWIKRVLAGINPFDQRYKDFESHQVNTIASMISQAGPRSSGATPLNAAGAANYGLIEIYGTVLDRGRNLSIEASNPVDYGPANDSLILVASRLNKLYTMLGNEAYADSIDPTIAYGTDTGDYGAQASSIFCFQNQLPTLLDEELALMRGRDDTQLPSTQTSPFYNRLIWNFTLSDGEVAYRSNYGIRDQNGDGVIDEADAKVLYPQGHGDAWGHYLTGLSSYYRLLRNSNFTWIPRSEAILVGGVPVSVDYQDERQFAATAAAKAKTGAEIVALTYRSAYVEDPAGQWQGYQDGNTNRAWGVSEWASRSGQGAYFDWVVGNALLPSSYQQSFQITENTLGQIEAKARYDLSDDVITNRIPLAAPGLTSLQATNLLNIPGRSFIGRQSILHALDAAIGVEARLKFQSAILGASQTNGLPESVISVLEILKGNQYTTEAQLTNTLRFAFGAKTFDAAYATEIRPYLAVPSGIVPTGIQKIDRTTVPELREISAAAVNIQEALDKADTGLNPLGLAKNALPFDINPLDIDQGTTHFEQIYQRAIRAMNNAIAVFNYAFNSSQLLRKQSDKLEDFTRGVADREADFKSRLIEIFGYPYNDDIGPTGSYASGYDGPDLYHYMYEESSAILGTLTPPSVEIVVTNRDLVVNSDGSVASIFTPVKYRVAGNGFGLVKPTIWTGQRRAPGEIQQAHLDLLQSKVRFQKAIADYDNLMAQIDAQAALLSAQYNLNAEEISLLNTGQGIQSTLNDEIRQSRERQLDFATKARQANIIADAVAEFFPTSAGFSFDPTSGMRGAEKLIGSVISEAQTEAANSESLAELDHQQAKELAQSQQNIKLTTLHQEQAILQQIAQMEQLVRQEAPLRLEIYNLNESLLQTAGRYSSALARGQRLIEDRLRFRQQTAEQVQAYRYNDMAFRIFRNDALQKYRAQFDQAAQYVYLAAKAYDFDTNLRPTDSARPGAYFLNKIVRARTIGVIQNGEPQTGGLGDPGLADPMAGMKENFAILKPQLGFNNPQADSKEFSLRSQLFRIQPGSAGNAKWREQLTRYQVENLGDIPEFVRHCLFQSTQAKEPGLVIPFSSTINQNLNFFTWPADLAGDSGFNPTAFSTKIRSIRVSFSNYRITGGSGLRADPRVYLVPIGSDILRSPRATPSDSIDYTREWRVVDQWLPTPFAINDKNDSRLATPGWIPAFSVGDPSAQFPNQGQNLFELAAIRAHPSFDAYHDNLAPLTGEEPQFQSAGLIGRSVWDTQWLLIIPGVNLLNDRDEGLQRFINGALVNDIRDGNGVSDIKIRFKAYAYSGR